MGTYLHHKIHHAHGVCNTALSLARPQTHTHTHQTMNLSKKSAGSSPCKNIYSNINMLHVKCTFQVCLSYSSHVHLGESPPTTSVYPRYSTVKLSLICRDKGRAKLVPGGPTALAWLARWKIWKCLIDRSTTTTTTTTTPPPTSINTTTKTPPKYSFCMTARDIEKLCVSLHN